MKSLKIIISSIAVIILITSFIHFMDELTPPNGGAIEPYLNGMLPNVNSSWETSQSFSGLTFNLPIWLSKFPNQEAYLLTTKGGMVWLIEKDENHKKKMILDISDQVFSQSDAGMFDIAFHPEFDDQDSPNHGYLYIMYNYLPPGLENPDLYAYYRLSRFYFDKDSKDISRNSELVLIQQFDRNWWHTGGALFFDNAGFLNFSVGDEGGSNDEFGNGQDIIERLFGGIFRIDVDMRLALSHEIRRYPSTPDNLPTGWPAEINQNYYIPNDNPWVSTENNWLEEYFVMGLRSPHTTYYDKYKDEIWVADVGQGQREEISIFNKGDNGQWPFKEGLVDGPGERPVEVLGNEIPPIYDYGRSQGRSIIGGFIYRGTTYPEIQGKYIFGDFVSQDIWCIDPETNNVSHLTNVGSNFVSFTDSEDGEIYLVQIYGPGTILSLSNLDVTSIEAPSALSELGVFENLETLQPINGVIPYELNSELYSDGAIKKRWVAIPNDGIYDSPDEQITFNETDYWNYPDGTVFIKHFELPVSNTDPGLTKRLETRFFVVKENGSYGLTYKWNDAGNEAYLLDDSDTKDFQVIQDGSIIRQTWQYPSRSQCLNCHNLNAGRVLGPSSHNMNKMITVDEAGSQRINQIECWNLSGLFSEDLNNDEIGALSATVSLDDSKSSNEKKVRSYLDVNCSFCHRPEGVLEANFDARFKVPLEQQNIIDNQTVSRNSIPANFIIKLGDTTKSEMYRRIHKNGDLGMPPLGRNLIDKEFVEVLKNWIMDLENPLSTAKGNSKPEITIFPNPSLDVFTIQLSKKFASYKHINVIIFTLDGKVVFRESYNPQHSVKIHSSLPVGVYIVEIASENNLISERIVINR